MWCTKTENIRRLYESGKQKKVVKNVRRRVEGSETKSGECKFWSAVWAGHRAEASTSKTPGNWIVCIHFPMNESTTIDCSDRKSSYHLKANPTSVLQERLPIVWHNCTQIFVKVIRLLCSPLVNAWTFLTIHIMIAKGSYNSRSES